MRLIPAVLLSISTFLVTGCGDGSSSPTDSESEVGPDGYIQLPAPGTSAAADGAPRSHPFYKWDTNSDSQLSREELPEGLRPHFDRLDADASGGISKTEMDSMAASGNSNRPNVLSAEAFERWDANGDGKLSLEELPQPFHQFKAMMDKNGDGEITKADL